MDFIDRSLLNLVQTDFPIATRPYLELAEKVGVTEEEAWQRINALRQNGIIRRLGGVFDSHRLGYKSTLCAAKVPEDKIDLLKDTLMKIPGVTHNYLRNHEYNIWFTLIASSQVKVEQVLGQIKELIGREDVYSLPALRVFKINVDFDFNLVETKAKDRGVCSKEASSNELISNELSSYPVKAPVGSFDHKPTPYPMEDKDKELVRGLQGDIPNSLTPFKEIAAQLGWQEEELLERTKNLLKNKVIRRFGAVLRHQKAGFTSNAMGVWQVPEEQIGEVGKIMAAFREVSHCYQRPALVDWPYNLFTMIHGRSREECEETMARIAQETGVKNYAMLFSLKELKKTSMQYFMED